LNTKAAVTAYTGKVTKALKDSSFTITVPANGIAAVAVTGAMIQSSFQQKILNTGGGNTGRDYVKLAAGNAHAMLFNLGEYGRRLYTYLEDDDNKYRKATLVYNHNGKEEKIEDTAYPYEFTVPVNKQPVTFHLLLTEVNGKEEKSETVTMGVTK
jgi:hypothetical protein